MDTTRTDHHPDNPSHPTPRARDLRERLGGAADEGLSRLSYDANGNHKEWRYRDSPQRTLGWDEDNRLVWVRENNQEMSRALYDGAGERRVHRHGVAGEEETAYVDQHLVVRNGVIARKHIFAGEMRLASKIDADWLQRPPVMYYHPDHLGSTQYVTDQDQELSQHVEYLPSGELWVDESDSRFQNRQPYLFTGKELDLSTGLYYYGARSLEPRLGVWLSPDPILDQYMRGAPNGGVYEPVNLGLYSYARNNPVVYVDPDGRSWLTKALKVGRKLLKGGDAADAFADNVQDAKTIIDPNASLTDKLIAGASLASEFLPVSASDLKDVKRAIDGADAVRDAAKKVEKADGGLDAARAARDARAAELGPLRPPERPATVTGGYHTETGKPATGCSGGGKCAEDRVVEALGGDPSKFKFTEAVRPRPHCPLFREVDVCERCEKKYGREPFPEGTKFESDERR
ncbi:RHS repeat domain-containing protein [Sorangium sp. So ce1097]|uniref:RHS repeat domain-containing protein n=1 Tax=Sorangium sp. So ce1097 TaxID=3133330 RepID=UPI003F624F5D